VFVSELIPIERRGNPASNIIYYKETTVEKTAVNFATRSILSLDINIASFPISGLLKPVTDITKENPSIVS
jgi:hypothetical protein